MDDRIKVFAISNQMAERALDVVEREFDVNLGRDLSCGGDEDDRYYPQFDRYIRRTAKEMSAHYDLFYCLEVSIRSLIKEKMRAELGVDWWNKADIPDGIRKNVKDNMQRDIDSGFTQRSEDELDYTTFGELAEVVRKNWSQFGDLFNSDKAFNRVTHSLNLLRGPIAHCSPLAEDEVLRLRLTVRDWFRLME